jgi:hypothetical protein
MILILWDFRLSWWKVWRWQLCGLNYMAFYPRKLSSLILTLFCNLFALLECYLPYRCTHLINGFLHIIQQVKAKIKTTIKRDISHNTNWHTEQTRIGTISICCCNSQLLIQLPSTGMQQRWWWWCKKNKEVTKRSHGHTPNNIKLSTNRNGTEINSKIQPQSYLQPLD